MIRTSSMDLIAINDRNCYEKDILWKDFLVSKEFLLDPSFLDIKLLLSYWHNDKTDEISDDDIDEILKQSSGDKKKKKTTMIFDIGQSHRDIEI